MMKDKGGIRRQLLEEGFARMDAQLRLLLDCFAQMLEEIGLKDVADALPWRSKTIPPRLSENASEAYSIAFQLLNMVEEQSALVTRRKREERLGPAAERGLWGFHLSQLASTPEERRTLIDAVLTKVRVEPVLTAHPTEAKRLAVLEQHRRLYRLLSAVAHPENPSRTERDELVTALERLWRTGEVALNKPTVEDERTNMGYYLSEVFPAVLQTLDRRFLAALENAGMDSAEVTAANGFPRLRFGTWVGGDRDGHPLVTAQTTAETLQVLRRDAVRVVRQQLSELGSLLTMRTTDGHLPAALEKSAGQIPREYTETPWRWYIRQLLERLDQDEEASHEGRAVTVGEIRTALELLDKEFRAQGASRIADLDIRPVLRHLDVFGLHLARLDIRQNSQFHEKALAQLMQAARLDGNAFLNDWDEGQRLAFLEQELRSPRPFLPGGASAGPEADAVVGCYRAIEAHGLRYGLCGLGGLIVSMTRSLSDLLAVYLLAREGRLCQMVDGRLASMLPVVPLFETIDDLDAAPGILDAFLSHPCTQSSLKLQAELFAERGPLTQEVMVGYSDSNKDAGIVASQWALHRAELRLSNTARQHGAGLRFFHGRGGTVSRGAGPTHRFLEALPTGSFTDDMRVTEQGETIAQKYANPSTAAYNLEVLLAGTFATGCRQARASKDDMVIPEDEERIMTLLTERSRAAYRAVVDTPGFVEFFRQATPIDAIEQSSIGSRPSRRTGAARLEDLRAIPWVFSWSQARYYLPGWFGAGSAFASLSETEFDDLRRLLKSSPLGGYAFTNIESSLASADADFMAAYASLVDNPVLRKSLFDKILGEWTLTKQQIERLFGASLKDRRPRLWKTLVLRADALGALHREQIALLREWRSLLAADDMEKAKKIFPSVLLSINAIAAGLRTTG